MKYLKRLIDFTNECAILFLKSVIGYLVIGLYLTVLYGTFIVLIEFVKGLMGM